MKTANVFHTTLATLIIATLPLNSCTKHDKTTTGAIPPHPLPTLFDYATTQDKDITLDVIDLQGNSLSGVTVSTYLKTPVSPANGTLLDGSAPIHSGMTDFSGKLEIIANLPTNIDSLYFIVHSPGFANPIREPLQSNSEMFISLAPIGYGVKNNTATTASYSPPMERYAPDLLYGNVYRMGVWDSFGVPNYLMPTRDLITASTRATIAGSLPEYYSVTKSHPEYFDDPTKANLNIVEDAQVWVTFVSAGTGYASSVGYFTYPTATPPRSAAEIDRRYVIMPNCSFLGFGGGLIEGSKVQLLYYDKKNNSHTTFFPAETSIGWFVSSNGYQGGRVTNGQWTMYSFKDFNPGISQQVLALHDPANKLMYITFEDISLTENSDKDFNDIVLYATSSPTQAIDQVHVPVVSKPSDHDKDGVPDVYDAYPTDPALAFDSHYPAKDLYGTIAYEESWPAMGDYDFNDLVVDLNIHQALNADNKVVTMNPSFRLRALGAKYHNSLALGLNCSPSAISSVSGQLITKTVFNISASGVESGVPTTVIPIFSNANDLFDNSPYTNTNLGQPRMEPVEINMYVTFTSPVDQSALGAAPYDPFMVIQGDRSREVHLVNKRPTAKANSHLLGTVSDASNPARDIWFISKDGHPWALSTPVPLDYPLENTPIGSAYKLFDQWAQSVGTQSKDWYLNKPNYRNNSLIYHK